jgi:hypothetical protein
MRQDFALQPWQSLTLPAVRIDGWVDRTADRLEIYYRVVGALDQLLIPAPSQPPSRRFGLWEATCLEFFLAPVGAKHYWEFNLSPNGDWNVFQLQDYRQGLQDAALVQNLPFQVDRQAQQLTLSLAMDLSGLVNSSVPLAAAITAVLQDRAGVCSYWALCHPGPEADFHRRDGFTVKLPGLVK